MSSNVADAKIAKQVVDDYFAGIVYGSLQKFASMVVFPDGQCLYIQWAMYM